MLLSLSTAFSSHAQDTDSEEQPLLLNDAINRSLSQNLGLKIQRIVPLIEDESIIQQEAAFDPLLTAKAKRNFGEADYSDIDSTLNREESDDRTYSAGISKRISTGATLNAGALLSRNDDTSQDGADQTASYSISITQPLLRDFGSNVSQAPIKRAQSKRREADFRLKNQVYDQLQATEFAYWRLADSYERRALRESNIKLAEDQLAETQERKNMGMATELETLQAESNLARRNEEIIRADQAIANAADTLMAAMGSLDASLSIENRPAVQNLVASENAPDPFQEVLSTSLERNFNAAIQNEILKQLEQDRILAENSKRPEVDLNLSSRFGGRSNRNANSAFDRAANRQEEDWGLELGLSLPWGRRASKSNLRQVDYSIDRAYLRLDEIEQDLIQSVRTAWRSLRTTQEQLRAAALVVKLQQATFDQEMGKYEEGLSSLRDVLETQRDLDNAVLSFLDAQLSTVESEIRLARAEGTLLERHALSWESVLDAPQ